IILDRGKLFQVWIVGRQSEPWTRWRGDARVHPRLQRAQSERSRAVNDVLARGRALVLGQEAQARRLDIIGQPLPHRLPWRTDVLQFLRATAMVCDLAFIARGIAGHAAILI